MTSSEATAISTREERIKRVRAGLRKSAIIWTPPFLACAGLFLFFLGDRIIGGDRGTWFLMAVLVIGAVLFGSQSIQSILDLAGKPRHLAGEVTRRWARADSLVVRTHYMRVGKNILRGDKEILDAIKAGDLVAVDYFPHSGVVISVEKQEKPVAAATPPPARGGPASEAKPAAAAPAEAPKVRNRRSVEPPKF